MSDTTVRPHVLTAVHQALDAHELGAASFYQVKYAAQRIYRDNWKRYRQAAGLWSDKDEDRLKRYPLPSLAAKHVFSDDTEVLRLMVSKDERLSTYRDALVGIMEKQDDGVLQDFVAFASRQNATRDSYPWTVTIEDAVTTFPGHDTYALWVSLKELIRK